MNKNDENYIYYLVGQNIKKQRKIKNMSVQKLAIASHYSEGFIMNIESPNYKQTFSLGSVWTFAKVLDVDIKTLFEPLDDDN